MRRLPSIAVVLALVGCEGVVLDDPASPGRATSASYEPGPAVLPRLTARQYRRSVEDLLGGPVPESAVEADTTPFLFASIGAASTTLSARGAQQFEEAAHVAADAVFADEARRGALVGCAPASADDLCARAFVARFLRRAFRRAIEDDELERWMTLARVEPDVWRGLASLVAGALQSPSFVYRVELGDPDPTRPGWSRLHGYELASRLSFVLWGRVPDAALLDAAERGVLDTHEGLRHEARRLLGDDRARETVRAFFREYLGLAALDALDRDPTLFPSFTPALGRSMRGEIERLVEHVVFEQDGDFRAIFDSPVTFVDAPLAALYELPIALDDADEEGFVRVTLPAGGVRAGLLTTAGFLAAQAHPNLTSPTRRGKFVRERLLCQLVADPPQDIELDLGEAEDDDGRPRTLRERLAMHRENPACATCHAQIDPIGLGMEDFDAIGAHRTLEAGRAIDATGDLDALAFEGARELGELMRHDGRVPACVTRQLFRHAIGRLEEERERRAIEELTERFAESGFRFRELLFALVTSEAFRTVRTTEIEEEAR
ncbi:DUF1592 domain-containing protein [Sandaracinus amylolyticus]|uniref:DUF1592 domain-containing protein n=1 Tax=Sandaracinus amylolyticus TaxID=927083 RepID=UPI00147023C8|nr:DUF1592 domain-containing protein [Sandaracinus amylolyticus]